MKKICLILIVLLFAELSHAQYGIKTNGTAFPVGWRKGELSLFQNGRYGTGRKSEINLHPLAVFMMPHIHYKKYWTNFPAFNRKIAFATRHGAYYPTLLLNFTRTQAFIPEDFRATEKAAHTIGFNNEFIFSTFLKPATHCDAPDHLLTLKLGAKYAYSFDTSMQAVVNKPVFHRESSSVKPEFIWNAQIALTGHLGHYLYYFGDLAFHSYKYNVENFSAESKLGAYGYFGDKFSFMGGVKLIYTNHPELKAFSVYPMINLYYHFQLKKKKAKERGLFKNDPFNFEDA
jgi:hypothetical protein